MSTSCSGSVCLCCLPPGIIWICLRHLLTPRLSDPCSQAWREGADQGTDGSWNTSRKSKGRLCDLLRKHTAKARCLEKEHFASSSSWVSADCWPQQDQRGFSLLWKTLSAWSLPYALTTRAEPNAIFILSKMNGEVETENHQSM